MSVLNHVLIDQLQRIIGIEMNGAIEIAQNVIVVIEREMRGSV
jgi:hypothetical protein